MNRDYRVAFPDVPVDLNPVSEQVLHNLAARLLQARTLIEGFLTSLRASPKKKACDQQAVHAVREALRADLRTVEASFRRIRHERTRRHAARSQPADVRRLTTHTLNKQP